LKSTPQTTLAPRCRPFEATALDAVNGLPFVIGEAPKALPAPATRMVDTGTVRRLAEGMTPKTWRHLRAELRTLTANPE
jgi:hypothetical protein